MPDLLRIPSSFVVAAYIKYASLLRASGALHLDIFEQPDNLRFNWIEQCLLISTKFHPLVM